MKALLALTLVALATLPVSAIPARDQGTVSGIVFDSSSGKPLPAVQLVASARTVRFVSSRATLDSAVATSDSLGAFVFRSLRADSYAAWVRPPLGWCPRWIEFVVSDTSALSLRVPVRSVTVDGDYIHC